MINKICLTLIASVLCVSVFGEHVLLRYMSDYDHPNEISPDNIRLNHITDLIDSFEYDLTNSPYADSLAEPLWRVSDEGSYILGFIEDERFSSVIYNQYSKRLFERFGESNDDVVLLYYRTGGNLEKLRELYWVVENENVKRAIEFCFFDASAELLKSPDRGCSTNTASSPLGIKLTAQPLFKYVDEMLFEPVEKHTGDPSRKVLQPNFDVFVEFQNVDDRYPLQISIPVRHGNLAMHGFRVSRDDQSHIIIVPDSTDIEKQNVTLYPGDRYIKKARFEFKESRPRHRRNRLFYTNGGSNPVTLGVYQLSNRSDLGFDINLQYECSYLFDSNHVPHSTVADVVETNETARSCSNLVPLSYMPVEKKVPLGESEKWEEWRRVTDRPSAGKKPDLMFEVDVY